MSISTNEPFSVALFKCSESNHQTYSKCWFNNTLVWFFRRTWWFSQKLSSGYSRWELFGAVRSCWEFPHHKIGKNTKWPNNGGNKGMQPFFANNNVNKQLIKKIIFIKGKQVNHNICLGVSYFQTNLTLFCQGVVLVDLHEGFGGGERSPREIHW